MELAAEAYHVARQLPTTERFELSSQLRRAATSVAANIAEGHSRRSPAEYLHFLAVARASLAEVDTHLALAERVGFLTQRDLAEPRRLVGEVGRMLTAMLQTLRSRRPNP
ncbi:MAG: four helix bundle protein [Gemmatimonadaceae bacterium]